MTIQCKEVNLIKKGRIIKKKIKKDERNNAAKKG